MHKLIELGSAVSILFLSLQPAVPEQGTFARMLDFRSAALPESTRIPGLTSKGRSRLPNPQKPDQTSLSILNRKALLFPETR